MKNFKFLSKMLMFNNIQVPIDLATLVLEICQTGINHRENSRLQFLYDNPGVDPNSSFSYPIPYNEIHTEFDNKKLWYGDSDYYEDTDTVVHYVFHDISEDAAMIFDVIEPDEGPIYIRKVEIEEDLI